MTDDERYAHFTKEMAAGAAKFIEGMRSDNPQWSKEYADGFEHGAEAAHKVWVSASIEREKG